MNTGCVLQVEDEDHDVIFLQLAWEAANVKNPVFVARDGLQAIAYLRGDGKFSDRREFPLPALVLLDIRLPYVPGLEVLKWIRSQPALRQLPVIIFTSSNQNSDVEAAYRLGANAYIVKPMLPAERLKIVQCIKKYWLDQHGPPANCEDWMSVTLRRPPPKRTPSLGT